MSLLKIKTGALLLAAGLFAAGCANTKDTTTSRSAVEQALMSQTARESIETLDSLQALAGMSYKIDDSRLVSADKDVILAQINQELLENGLNQAKGDEADLTLMPYADYSAIDQGKYLIGIPSILLPAPGGGQVPLPEIALFKRDRQEGRNSIGLVATKDEDGSLAFSHDPEYAARYYTRYTVLFLINFNHSDLDKPFKRDTLF